MRISRTRHALRIALGTAGIAMIGLCMPVAASAAPHAYGAHEHRHEHSHRQHGPFMHALRKLGLTPQQRTQVRELVHASREEGKIKHAPAASNWEALSNPGDLHHAEAVQAAQARAAGRIQRRSELEGKIYALLTPEQKADLPTILTRMRDGRAEHRDRHWARRDSPSPA
jgi:Spy/CpxP family protein refolding chaperone